MRFNTICKLAAAASLGLLAQMATSTAGSRGCVGQCYEQVPAPAYTRTFKRRALIREGAYEIEREPSLYGLSTRRVLLDDGVDWHEKPAVYKTVKVKRHIKARTVWQKKWVDGKYIKCKVKVPGKTVWTTKKVMVSPAKRWKTRSKPVYGYTQKRILVRPYKNIAVYHRAKHRYVREHVVIQPETTVWAPYSGPAYRY